MPRRKSSTNPPPAPTPPSSKAKSHKRALSSSAATAEKPVTTPGSRASKRLKESASSTGTPSTAKKSKYFEGADSGDDDEDADPTSADEDEASDFDDASLAEPESSPSVSPSASDVSDSSSSDDDEEDDGKKRKKKKKKKKTPLKSGRKPTAAESGAAGIVGAVVEAGKELWRQGVKTGLGPGKQVFIARPKPRDDGGVKYVPGRVHPNTMAFLADLKRNNDREWLKSECLSFFPLEFFALLDWAGLDGMGLDWLEGLAWMVVRIGVDGLGVLGLVDVRDLGWLAVIGIVARMTRRGRNALHCYQAKLSE